MMHQPHFISPGGCKRIYSFIDRQDDTPRQHACAHKARRASTSLFGAPFRFRAFQDFPTARFTTLMMSEICRHDINPQ